jgi:RNA polymerase sigma-70 factor (ECF subfamily)
VVGRPLANAEADLVARARRGDAAAYEQLIVENQGIAFRTAYLVAGNAADAEEAAQDGFVKAYRALWRFRPGAPFRPWLLAIVANEARNRRRSAGRREQLALRAAREAASAAPQARPVFGRARPASAAAYAASGDTALSPEAALLGSEQREELLEAVNRLPEIDRLAIACRYFLELSEEETAAALGCRRGTVKSRLSRALERLRGELGVEL